MAGSVSVLLVRPLVLALGTARLGPFWAATDLTPELVADDDARLSPAQFCVAWAEALRLSGNPQLALAIAQATPVGSFGIVEYVCRSAPTLGEALHQWARYLNIINDALEVGLTIEGDRAYFGVVRDSEAPAPQSHELCLGLVAYHSRQLASAPFRFLALELKHSGNPAPYRAWFDAPVVFGAESTRLVLPKAALDIALVSSDPQLLAILTRAAGELARKGVSDATIASQVARVLREELRADHGTIEHTAKRLGMTARSLQRRLKDENTSFQNVREQVRQELAQRYLEERMSIAEISFLLGFSEPSAFFRAFKRWTGVTPVEARRRASASA